MGFITKRKPYKFKLINLSMCNLLVPSYCWNNVEPRKFFIRFLMYDLVTKVQVVDAFSNLNGCDRENGIVFHKAHV